MKYTIVKISGIITQIAKKTEVNGYSVGLLECFLPDDDEMKNWSQKQINEWITNNNKRMEAICKLLNDKQL